MEPTTTIVSFSGETLAVFASSTAALERVSWFLEVVAVAVWPLFFLFVVGFVVWVYRKFF